MKISTVYAAIHGGELRADRTCASFQAARRRTVITVLYCDASDSFAYVVVRKRAAVLGAIRRAERLLRNVSRYLRRL